MPDSPFFSSLEADRILKRAADIEGSEETRHLTADELRLIAREAGFGREAIDRAIAEAREADAPAGRRPPVRKQGLIITRLSTVREVPIDAGSEQIMRAVRLFQPYHDGPPQVKLAEREVTWQDRRGIRFSVTSAAGVTEIRVGLSKVLLRKGRWMGRVKSAADRLETLVSLVAGQARGGARLRPGAPVTDPSGRGAEPEG